MKYIFTLSLILLATACEGTPFPDWSEGFPEGTSDPTTELEAGQIVLRSGGLGYDTRLSDAVDPTQNCTTNIFDGFTDIQCQAEVKELDLSHRGFAFTVDVSARSCVYLSIESYTFQRWESGEGPAVVHFQVNADGDFIGDVANSLDGRPNCEFNHSVLEEGAPNCCQGTFQTQVTVVDGEVSVDLPLSPPQSWGGRIGNCYDGAAYVSNFAEFDEVTGVPIASLIELEQGSNAVFTATFAAPSDSGDTSNVKLANYLDDGDAVPVGYLGEFSSPEYIIECLDEAQDVRSRIRLTVREWDEVGEFETFGDPDSGRKPDVDAPQPLEDNGSNSPINDLFDWSDFVLEGNEFLHFSG